MDNYEEFVKNNQITFPEVKELILLLGEIFEKLFPLYNFGSDYTTLSSNAKADTRKLFMDIDLFIKNRSNEEREKLITENPLKEYQNKNPQSKIAN